MCNSERNVCENARSADAIFIGKAIAVPERQPSAQVFSSEVTTFEVSAVFRGNVPARLDVLSAGECGYEFHAGGEYLVFARQHRDGFSTGICSGNEPMKDAGDSLRYLRSLGTQLLDGHILPSHVFGRISNRTQKYVPLLLRSSWPAPGVRVRAWKDDFEVRTIATDSGWYDFFDLPPGRYQLAVESTAHYQAVGEASVDVQAGSCRGVAFVNTSRAVLKGRLVDYEGEPDGSSDLRLVPMDMPALSHDFQSTDSELETEPQEDGSFRFEVPAGRYRLTVKPLGETTLVCYPEILVLEDLTNTGSRETEIEFRLPKPPVQSIEGIVLDADGRPVQGAVVNFFGKAPDGSVSFGHIDSDSEGAFGFAVLPMDYEIFAEWPACERLTSAKTLVKSGQTTQVLISLPLRRDRRCPSLP